MPSVSESIAPPLPGPGDLLVQKYRIERCIGRGGMGAVYLARHEMLDQLVAIKILLPEVAANPEAVSRFVNEARNCARITNEHVAKVLDVETPLMGGAFMVLEFLEGVDLATHIARNGAVRVEEAVDYLLQALEAVAQAHALGIVHRDLKPANLFLVVGPDGQRTIKVLDFGISKTTDSVSGLTATNMMLGSPQFMSPEQVRSSKNVDARADIWSLGVCLYQLVTAEMPFKGDHLGSILAAILENDPVPPSAFSPLIAPELDEVVGKCMQRDRDKRYANVIQLARALEPFAPPEARGSVEKIRRTMTAVNSRTPNAYAPSPVVLATATPRPPGRASGSSSRSPVTNEPRPVDGLRRATPLPVPKTPAPAPAPAPVPVVAPVPSPPSPQVLQPPSVGGRSAPRVRQSRGGVSKPTSEARQAPPEVRELSPEEAAGLKPTRTGRTALIVAVALALAGLGAVAVKVARGRPEPVEQPSAGGGPVVPPAAARPSPSPAPAPEPARTVEPAAVEVAVPRTGEGSAPKPKPKPTDPAAADRLRAPEPGKTPIQPPIQPPATPSARPRAEAAAKPKPPPVPAKPTDSEDVLLNRK